jgi:hypothetical protein
MSALDTKNMKPGMQFYVGDFLVIFASIDKDTGLVNVRSPSHNKDLQIPGGHYREHYDLCIDCADDLEFETILSANFKEIEQCSDCGAYYVIEDYL